MLKPNSIRAVLIWLLAALLPIFVILPAITQPIEETAADTAVFHIYRTVVFSDARAENGAILPRWTQPTNGGLGGPLFAYTPALMYLVMDEFHALGLDFVYTWRATTALMLVLASVGMFGLGRALFRRSDVALLSAAAFVYAPLLLRDFIERGSPQALGVSLFPWVLWAVVRLIRHPNGLSFTGVAISWGLLLFAHNLSALLLAPVIGLLTLTALWGYALPRRITLSRMGIVVLALAMGSFLVAFYAFPIFAELQYIQIDNPQHTTHAYPPDNPARLDEIVTTTPPIMDTGIGNNGLGPPFHSVQFTLGGLIIILWIVALPLMVIWFRRKAINLTLSRHHTALGLFLLGLGLLSALLIWLQTDFATPVWRTLSFLDVLQFRFRLLTVVSLAIALSLGCLVPLFNNLPRAQLDTSDPTLGWDARRIRPDSESTIYSGVIAILMIVLGTIPLYPQYLHHYNNLDEGLTVEDVKMHTTQAGTASLAAFNEYVPKWRHMPFTVDEMQRAADQPIANLPPGATITYDMRTATRWSIGIDTPEPFTARFYLLYYPGWEAHIDVSYTPVQPAEDNTGYLLVDIPEGAHTITLNYAGTTAQRLGDLTSMVTLFILLAVVSVWRSSPQPPRYLPDALPYPAARLSGIALAALVLIAGIKTLWFDEQIGLARESTCDSIHAVDNYPAVEFAPYRLCGYTWHQDDNRYHPGDTLTVDLYWQIDTAQDRLATSFVHLVGESFNPQTNSPTWNGSDHQTPGERLVVEWVPGKLYRDTFRFKIPDHAPPGTYQLEVGWYTWDNGARIVPTIADNATGAYASPWESLILLEIEVQ